MTKTCKFCGKEFEQKHKAGRQRDHCYQSECIELKRLEANEKKRIYMANKPKPAKSPKICIFCKDPFMPKDLGRKRNHCFKKACIKKELERQRKNSNEKRRKQHVKRPYRYKKSININTRRCVKCGRIITNGNYYYCSKHHSEISDTQVDFAAYGGLVGK